MQIKFEVNGQVQLSRNLRLTAVNLKDLQPFIKESLDIIHKRTNNIFKSRGNNVEKNPKWPSLAIKTEKARNKRWGYYKNTPNNPSILRWTGRLQDDITKKSTNEEGILIYNAPYAVYHQDGGKRLPKRAIIDISNETANQIIKTLQKKVNNDLRIFGKQL